MKNNKRIMFLCLCLCLSLLLIVSLAACKETDEQNSAQPTPSTQPTAAPTPTPTPPIPFTDVAGDSPYYDAVVWAYKNGIASDGETFGPADACTRGQVMTFLWRANGSPEPQVAENPFNDVSPDNWFYKPALWAYESGISTSSSFKPTSPCTNGEALTFLWRAEGKPIAALGSSAIALAAPNQYFTRPVAWAETNGLLSAEVGFNPSANCLRADLMSYLYWAEEQRASAKESRALQAEYEKIIQDAKLYEVHGSGLCYADYVDVNNDGKVELLTVGTSGDKDGYHTYDVTATVYGDMDGHIGKLCEQTFSYGWEERWLYICTDNSHVCFQDSMLWSGASCGDAFYKIENGTFVHSDSVSEEFTYDEQRGNVYLSQESAISKAEYDAIIEGYTNQKMLLYYHRNSGLSAHEHGILPAPGIEVNGSTVKLSANPHISDGALTVPLRDVLEAMGVAVYANPDASAILASTKSDTLVITYKDFSDWSFKGINSDYYGRDKTYKYSMNGGEFQKSAIEFTDGKAFVPLQTIVSLFGAKAEWNGKAGAMQITSNIPDSSRMSQDELKQIANFDLEQAQSIAVNKGYKGPWDEAPMLGTGMFEFYDTDDVKTLAFKNGKAVWTLYTWDKTEYLRDETGRLTGELIEMHRIDVANDGTITEYPNDKVHTGAGQT